jgi:hypothetical protein
MDATFFADILYVLIASTCVGFVVYGGWLCIDRRERAPEARQQTEPALHAGTRESSL